MEDEGRRSAVLFSRKGACDARTHPQLVVYSKQFKDQSQSQILHLNRKQLGALTSDGC